MMTFYIFTALIALFIGSPIVILALWRARERARAGQPGMAWCQRLTRLVMRLFDQWDVDEPTARALLGMEGDNRTSLQDYRRGDETLPCGRATLDRIAHLLAIDTALGGLYRTNEDMRYSWVHLPNHKLDGSTPLAIMSEGEASLARVARLAETEAPR